MTIESRNFTRSTSDPLSVQLANVNMNLDNIVSIFEAIKNSITGDAAFANAELETITGETITLSIPSSSFLYKEVKRIDTNMQNFIGMPEGGSSIVDTGGNVRKVTISSLLRSLPGDFDLIKRAQFAKVDVTSAIYDLMFPMPKIEFTLPKEFDCNNVIVRKIRLDGINDITYFSEGLEYHEVIGIATQKNIGYTVTEDNYSIDIKNDNLYGSFNILSVSRQANGNIEVILDKLTYSDIRSISDSRELEQGDFLSDKQGNGVYQITQIDKINSKVILNLSSGFDKIEAGIKTLWYQYATDTIKTVSVPIQSNERSLIFISPINPNSGTTSGISKSYILDTSSLYIVNSSNASVQFDTWFNNNVINVGNYLKSVAEDVNIPLAFGIKPDEPKLDAGSFQVMQINKHITDTSDVERIRALASEKETIFSKISTVNKRISDVNTRINTGRYRSVSDKNDDTVLLSRLIDEKDQLTKAYESLVSDIYSKTENVESVGYDPKYRVRGFWSMQKPISSSNTRDQHIIKYRVEYRYLNARENTSNASTIKYLDNDQYRTGIISSWNYLYTPQLLRIRKPDGTYEWKENQPENGDNETINQCDIPISPNESVEIRIKACSEAGFPTTMLESEWSDILRIDFPAELLRESSIAQTIDSNKEDLKKVQMEQFIRERGILTHVAGSFTEQERYFAHQASQIASGFYTNEQKTISVQEILTELKNNYSSLYNKVYNIPPEITVDIVDASGAQYTVTKNGTIQLSAGFYADNVDLTNSNEYGKIVEKVYYIRLQNLNTETMQMFSRYPGKLSELITTSNVNDGDKYIDVPYKVGTSIKDNAHLGQYIYCKNIDIYGNELYKEFLKNNTIDNSDIDKSGEPTTFYAAYLDSSENVQRCKLTQVAKLQNFIMIHSSYPYFGDDEKVKEILKRCIYNDSSNIEENILAKYNNSILNPGCYYEANDRYLLGTYSCGAKMYLGAPSLSFIQVNGATETSYKEILTGQSNAILIPVYFQYRMTDALKNLGAIVSENQSTNFEYRKKLSIELYLNKKLFEFDIEIYAKFKNPDISSGNLTIAKKQNIKDSIDSMDSTLPTIK